ncbi:MAG: hypothetical protein WCD42_06345 [Rhizomicrobium sp.]
MKKPLLIAVTVLAALSLTGCGILFPSAKMRATKNTPGFKAGFADGCSAATAPSADYSADKFRDKALYDSDANYRFGWGNGMANCRPSNERVNPNAGPVPDISPGAMPH